jgi:short-subunit dehydrogenase
MSTFADRVVVITGAGSGIGRQFALQLAREGAKIAALDLREEGLKTLADEIRTPLEWAVADVTDFAGLQATISSLEEKLGPTDILIANAGVGRETHTADYNALDADLMIRVNLIGVSNSFAAVLPGMRERRSGHLVGIASLASYCGIPRMGAYCATKAGVRALCDAFRVELRPLGISVTTICPGFIKTPMTESLVKLKRYPALLTVEYAVGRMVEAIRRKKAFLAFPFSSRFQVALLRYLPRPLADWLAYRMYARSLR